MDQWEVVEDIEANNNINNSNDIHNTGRVYFDTNVLYLMFLHEVVFISITILNLSLWGSIKFVFMVCWAIGTMFIKYRMSSNYYKPVIGPWVKLIQEYYYIKVIK